MLEILDDAQREEGGRQTDRQTEDMEKGKHRDREVGRQGHRDRWNERDGDTYHVLAHATVVVL